MRTKVEYDDRTIAFTEGGKIVIHCNGKKMLSDVVITIEHTEPDVPEEPDEPRKLAAPTISLDGDILTIEDGGDYATSIDILDDGRVIYTHTNTNGIKRYGTSLALFNFTGGTHSITVKAKKEGYLDSDESNVVSYKILGETKFTVEAGNASGTYYYECGMTWSEWLESDYNTAGFVACLSQGVTQVGFRMKGNSGYGYYLIMTLDGPRSVTVNDRIDLDAYYSYWRYESEINGDGLGGTN